jgi:AcrR family transcriptional regulator
MPRNSNHTKKLIDDTALRLFVEKGVARTTIKDIAATAGIAEGTLYRHYTGKSELAWRLFADNIVLLAKDLDHYQQEQQTLKSKIAAIINATCSLFDANPVLFRYLLLDHHGHIRKMTPDMPSPVRVLKTAIVQGIAVGEIPPADEDVKTAEVLGLILQVAVFKIYGHISHSLASLAPTIVEDCMRVLGA